jgi:hypothetical protein
MRNLILTILTIYSSITLGQKVEKFDSTKISSAVMTVVKNFETKDGMIENAFIGIAGQPSEQFEVFKRLCNTATESELIELTKHTEPIIRGYSFWGLAKINSVKLESILREHVSDTANIITMSGCLVGTKKVNTFMLDVVTPKVLDNCKKLSSRTRREIKEEIDAL